MKIVVLGASGATGREVVAQAVGAGADVTAVVREGSAAPDGATVVRAELRDAARLATALHGADAVISALGPRGRGPTTVCADGTRAAVTAMRETGVRRLLLVSAAGLPGDGEDALTRLVARPIVGRVFRHVYADLAEAERIVRASGLEWTIVRPARLTGGPPTGRYRRAVDRHVRGGHTTVRADVAAELLRALADDATVGHMVAVAN